MGTRLPASLILHLWASDNKSFPPVTSQSQLYLGDVCLFNYQSNSTTLK